MAPGNEGKTKVKILQRCLLVIGTISDTNLARHIPSNFFNSVCLSGNVLIETVLFAAFHSHM